MRRVVVERVAAADRAVEMRATGSQRSNFVLLTGSAGEHHVRYSHEGY